MQACLVLPTFNEAPNLEALLAAVRKAVPDLRILVVDDRSPDGTGALAEQLAARDPGLAVLHRDGPRGFGGALTAGFRRALAEGAEAIVTMDGDFSHDPAEIPRLLAVLYRLPARDCTSGFRAYRRRALEAVPWDRLHSPGYSFLVEVLYWASRSSPARVREVPICFTERRAGTSKMGWREIVAGAGNLLKLRLALFAGGLPGRG